MKHVRPWTLLSLTLMMSGCDSKTAATENHIVVDSGEMTPAETPAAPAAPNYDEREGDLYMYVAAVSEEDQKKGKATGNVVLFRYLGMHDGVYRLENVRDNGTRLDVSECASPCRVIKSIDRNGSLVRTGYNPRSVIGNAFEDAFAGRLVVAREASKSTSEVTPEPTSSESRVAIIPAAFRGEWNEDLKYCGTGQNDSRLRVEPARLRFYESDGEVTGVTVHTRQAVSVQANFAGEGETWQRDVQMVLSRSGADLTIEGYTRHRCPA